jgi:hypothetical protein
MSDMRAATAPELAYLRTAGQWSKLYAAGLTIPPTIFAARVNQVTWDSYDKIYGVPFDTVTTGAWTDIVAGMTLWVGDTAGGRERGECRVRSTAEALLWIGETSDIEWADDLYLTVKDEMLLWPRHVRIGSDGEVWMDNSVIYTDQHENFDPVPLMGSDAVIDLQNIITTQLVTNGTFDTVTTGWTAGSGVLLTVATAALHINRNGAGVIDHAYQNVTTQTGMIYTFSVNVKAYSHQYEVYVDGVKKFDTTNGTGVKTVSVTATSTTTKIAFRALNDSGATLDVDDVSLISASKIVAFPEAANSWVFGSTITGWNFASNAGTWTNPTTSGAVLAISSYPTNGLIRVSLTVSAENGKTCTGYRYIYVYDASHLPEKVFQLANLSADYDTGGWSFDLTMFGDLSAIRDRAKVILFSADYFGGTRVYMGQATGRENIIASGYVSGETTEFNAESSQVTFNVQGPQFWLGKMTGFPPGVEILGVASWTRILDLTVDRAVWHLLHWRATATAVMDVNLTGDTRLASAFEIPAESLWAQIVEIAQTSIFASPGCNRLGQFYLEIEPQVVPEDERTWATVMALTEQDWQDKITMLCGCDVHNVSMLSSSGVSVNAAGAGTPYFSLSPGHVFKHYGDVEVNDQLLLSSQEQSNELAGLLAGWKNNYYPSFDITLAQNNRMLDLFPRSFCSIAIAAGDTIRGKAYSGNLILRSMSLEHNTDTGAFTTGVNFEAETFTQLNTNGDPPPDTGGGDGGGGGGCGQTSCPSGFYLDENHCCIATGGGGGTPGAKVVALLTDEGMFYTVNFDAPLAADVVWIKYTEGLTFDQIDYAEEIFLTPDGHVYIMNIANSATGKEFIAVASALGEPFTILVDDAWINAAFPAGITYPNENGLLAFGINPLAGNVYAFVAGERIFTPGSNNMKIYYNSLSGSAISCALEVTRGGSMVYVNGGWTTVAPDRGVGAYARIFINDGGSTYKSTLELTGSRPKLWAIEGDTKCVFLPRAALDTPHVFTGVGTDEADWTFHMSDRTSAMALDPTGASIMAAGAPVAGGLGGLWLSSDSGGSWSAITTPEGLETSLSIANAYSPLMWVASRENTHVYYTADGGATWENRAGSMVAWDGPVPTVRGIVIASNPE